MEWEWEDFDADDVGAHMHGRRVISESNTQRQVDALWARLRSERAESRRARLREARVSGRRTWKGPGESHA